MTREEAIEILQGAIKKPNTKDGYLGQAIDMAIKALEQYPKYVPIAVIKYDKDKLKELVKKEFKAVLTVAPQEPKTGNWFVDERPESDREIICSNCEQPIFKYHKMDFDYRPKYCPNCGAKMGVRIRDDKR